MIKTGTGLVGPMVSLDEMISLDKHAVTYLCYDCLRSQLFLRNSHAKLPRRMAARGLSCDLRLMSGVNPQELIEQVEQYCYLQV